MARFIFPLQNILTMKEKLEDQAKNEYSQANLRLREAEEEEERLKQRQAEAERELSEMLAEVLDVMRIKNKERLISHGNRRGREIVRVSTVDNIASQAELQAYAERLRNDSLLTSETVSVTTGLLPGWEVADVVALHTAPRVYIERTRRGKRFVAYPGSNDICISRAFDMELKVGGKMRHTLEKVVYNLE